MGTQEFGFDWAIAPFRRETFFAEHFEKKHLVIQRDDPDYFADLLSFAEVDHVVSTMGLHAPEILLTNNTDHADADLAASGTDTDASALDFTHPDGRVDPVRVAKGFAEGATVILSGLQERLPKLARFCRALESVMSARVQTNAYLTPGGHQGFKPHYDSHDVLVLQVEGSKEWRIYDSAMPLPLPSQGFQPGATEIGAETDRFVLHPGDAAYIPRGLAHDAVATDETSLHITTGLMFQTWADLLSDAVRVMAQKDPDLRAAIPPGFADGPEAVAGLVPQFDALLTRLSETAPTQSILEAFRQDFIASRPPRVEGQLGQTTGADSLTLQSAIGAQPDLVYDLRRIDGTDPHCELRLYGQTITLPEYTVEPLEYALATQSFTPATLPGQLDDAGKLVLVKRLIREGAVRML